MMSSINGAPVIARLDVWVAYVLVATLVIIPILNGTTTSYAVEEGGSKDMFAAVQSKKVIGAERLAELSSAYLDDNRGFLFSEINWSNDGQFVIFETENLGTLGTLWIMTPDGNEERIRKINFPYEQYPGMARTYKLSPNGEELLFVGIKENPEAIDNFGRENLHRFNLNDSTITKISNYENQTYVAAFDWLPDDNVVYETIRTIYGDVDAPPIHVVTLWTASAEDGKIIKMLWNDTIDFPFNSLDASPDGTKLALTGASGLSIFDMNELKFINIIPKSETGKSNSPKWSSNSEFIVYWHTEYKGGFPSSFEEVQNRGPDDAVTSLRIASMDGSINEEVFQSPGIAPSGELLPAAISPDGRFIAVGVSFVPFNYKNDRIENSGLYLIDLGTAVIPEFPAGLTIVAAAASVAGVIVAVRKTNWS